MLNDFIKRNNLVYYKFYNLLYKLNIKETYKIN